MRIADTSALYALFARGDAHHARARSTLQDPEHIVIPSEIFVETINLIQYRIGHDEAVAASGFLRGLPNVQVRPSSPGVLSQTWAAHSEARGKLSLADALVVAWCLDEDATPFTFDRKIPRALARLR